MSLPKIPDLNPNITIKREDAVNILIASIGLEELALAHILNAEGEKIQYVLGTLEGADPGDVTVCDVLQVNESVNKTLRNVIQTEMMLLFKLEDALQFEQAPKHTVTYLPGSGGTGGPHIDADIASGTSYTVLTLEKTGITPKTAGDKFVGWRTPEGLEYEPGDAIVITSDLILTAVWET